MLSINAFKRFALAFLSIYVFFIFIMPVYAVDMVYKFNMSYIYFGDTDAYISKVDSTKNSLNEISPNYFDLNDNGTLQLTKAIDLNFIKEMHKRGIKVVPFLSNHWDREKGRKALALRNDLALQIADTVWEYGLDGVNVDIENLTEEDRDDYTDFVRLLKGKMPEGKTLAVAAAPNPLWSNKGWQGSYDYKSLSRYADYIMVMAYDQSYQGGPAGPVASAPFVENSIIYALENVPREKVVIGIPFYGRYWKDGSGYGGYGISLKEIEELISKYRGKVSYDWTFQSPKATITIKSGDKKPVIFGNTLGAGTYTIWYENEQSIKYKLKLVQKYGIKGTGSWSLGQETESTWDYYRLWINGWYFSDVQGHWAQDDILSMAMKGLMTGVSDSSFKPEKQLTRAEAATLMVRALGLEESTTGAPFKDTFGHWAEKEINIAAQSEIIVGMGNGMFEPDRLVTRQEIAVIAGRLLKQMEIPSNAVNPFRDVSLERNYWAYDSIVKMAHYGIINGYPNGNFKPEGVISRTEMAVLMGRIDGYLADEGG